MGWLWILAVPAVLFLVIGFWPDKYSSVDHYGDDDRENKGDGE